MKVRNIPGEIRQHSNGYWYYDIRWNGTRYRVSLKTKMLVEARMRAVQAFNEIVYEPAPLTSKTVRLSKLREEYTGWQTKARKASETIRLAKVGLTSMIELVGDRLLREITQKMADDFAADQASKRQPAGASMIIRATSTAFSRAVRWGWIERNPFQRIELPRDPEDRLPRILSVEELKRIFEQVRLQHPDMEPLYRCYLGTGCRRGELLNLRTSDINFEMRSMWLAKTKIYKGRQVPLLPMVLEILKERSNRPKLFDYSGSHVTHIFKRMARDAGIKDVHLHNLRSTFASYLAAKGMPPEFTQKVLGHSSLSITLKYYVGYRVEMIRPYMDALQRMFDGKILTKVSPQVGALGTSGATEAQKTHTDVKKIIPFSDN